MTARRVVAALWLSLAAAAAIGHAWEIPLAVVGAWFGALLVLGASGSSVRAHADERLERPLLYRATAALAFAVPVAGALLATVPGHDGLAALFAPYFVVVALLQYRALVANGPRGAPLAMCVALLLWIPFCFPLALMGCKCCGWVPPPPHWTKTAVPLVLLATMALDAVLCAAALLSFAHHDDVPEARLTTGS